jgi:hypothetical protein
LSELGGGAPENPEAVDVRFAHVPSQCAGNAVLQACPVQGPPR